MSEIKSNRAWRLECEELRNTNQRQQAEIERLYARIKDYQDACTQKQEIINGSAQDIERMNARVKELEKLVADADMLRTKSQEYIKHE